MRLFVLLVALTPLGAAAQNAPARAPQSAQPDLPPAPPQWPDRWVPAKQATLLVLNKIDAVSRKLSVPVGQQTAFQSLTIHVDACIIRPSDQPADAAAFLDISDFGCERTGLPRLDPGERAVAVDAAESGVRCAGPWLRVMPLALPPPARTAFLLDIDGTLLDFAPTPLAVEVPPGLPETLVRLKHRVGGALALISGRPLEQVVMLFGDVPHAIAGEHGGAVRHSPGGPTNRMPLAEPAAEWLVAAEELARSHPGSLLEHKANGFVVHYRQAPNAGDAIGLALSRLIAGDSRFILVPAQMAWEVRSRGADKGMAVEAIMGQSPFSGRLPVFIGDDVTDLDGVHAVQAMAGVGLMVPETFGTPAAVRAWLTNLAERGW